MVNRRVVFPSILILSLLLTLTLGTVTQMNLSPRISDPVKEFAALTPHDPIVIVDNDDFVDLGFPGNGNETNPYRIENISITTSNTAIAISETSAHYLIRNCSFTTSSDSNYAVSLCNSDNGTIENCTVTAEKNGISLHLSHNITIRNSTITQPTNFGILVHESNDCVIELNQIRDVYWGIKLWESVRAEVSFNQISETNNYCILGNAISHCSIYNNTLLPETAYSLRLVLSCTDIIIANNSVQYPAAHGLYYAFTISDSQNISLIRNSFVNNGISITGDIIEEWNSHTIEYNTIDGVPIAYIKDDSNKAIDASSYGEVILANSSHCNVSNGVFDDCYIGIVAGFCESLLIEGCSALSVTSALLKLYYCNNSIVSDCHVEISENNGMSLFNCNNSSIINSTTTNCWTGIALSGPTNTNLTGCIISSSWDCIEGSNLEDCTFIDNVFQFGAKGIAAYRWSDCLIANNTFNQLGTGLHISTSNRSLIIGNIFSNNDYGVRVFPHAYNNSVYDNTFYGNDENALDDGNNSLWDDGIAIGNVWDDFNGTGYYYIPGSAASVDHYPRLPPDTTPPTISGPSDVFLDLSVSSYTLTWYPTDENPSSYLLLFNSSGSAYGDWNGAEIEITIPIIEIGTYNITLIVYDIYGNFAVDTVIIVVQEVSSTTTTTTIPTDDTSTGTTSSDTTTDSHTDETPIIPDFLLIIIILSSTGLVCILAIVSKMKSK